RSKLGAMYELGMEPGLDAGDHVLYLGAANGTTASHVADVAGPTYAVEFAARPMRDLLSVAETRGSLLPLLKAARSPETYAHVVESAARPMRDLLSVAETRGNLFPLLKDARNPETYAHVVEDGLDLLVQDVATRGQARVARANRQFLRDDGRLCLAIKARSEDATREPDDVFADALDDLREGYEILDSRRLDPFHADHLAVVATPR